MDYLACYPEHHQSERQLDKHYRHHVVMRLKRYYQPLNQHLDLEQQISIAIRQGYIARNPLGSNYRSLIHSCYSAIRDKDYSKTAGFFSESTAYGFSIIGMSGVGKSSTIQKILQIYPQVINHQRYKEQEFPFTQVTWLKLDCPSKGVFVN